MPWAWLTTAPNQRPGFRAHTHGADQGQRGWKLHLVYVPRGRQTRGLKAFCGVRPPHGWGLDMFITDTCKRCERLIEKRKFPAPERFK